MPAMIVARCEELDGSRKSGFVHAYQGLLEQSDQTLFGSYAYYQNVPCTQRSGNACLIYRSYKLEQEAAPLFNTSAADIFMIGILMLHTNRCLATPNQG